MRRPLLRACQTDRGTCPLGSPRVVGGEHLVVMMTGGARRLLCQGQGRTGMAAQPSRLWRTGFLQVSWSACTCGQQLERGAPLGCPGSIASIDGCETGDVPLRQFHPHNGRALDPCQPKSMHPSTHWKQLIAGVWIVVTEVVFFHATTRTLLLTDLIENFETRKLALLSGALAHDARRGARPRRTDVARPTFDVPQARENDRLEPRARHTCARR